MTDDVKLPEGVEKAIGQVIRENVAWGAAFAEKLPDRHERGSVADQATIALRAAIAAALDERDAEARKWKGHAQRADLRAREVATERAAREAAEARVRELEGDAARWRYVRDRILRYEVDGLGRKMLAGYASLTWPVATAPADLTAAVDAARQAGEVEND